MLREAIAAETELGVQVQSIVSAGELVSDDLVVAIVDERLDQKDALCGYLLDGFPRNIAQAEALNDAVVNAIGTVVVLDVATDELVARLLNRAREEGRADDTEEVIRRRLEVYETETAPLVAYYGDAAITVDGSGSIEDVFSRIVLALAR
ncbi:MAG: adenylate kinase family protein, partial [Acidimicrobiia bacterium]